MSNTLLGDCLMCPQETLSTGIDPLTAATEIRIGKPVPQGHVIVHLCGNPDCVNPFHLLSDTTNRLEGIFHSDLVYQPPVGEDTVNAKLTEDDVQLIVSLLDDEVPQRLIARRFGVTQQAISRIATGTAWSHITGIPKPTADQLWAKLTTQPHK